MKKILAGIALILLAACTSGGAIRTDDKPKTFAVLSFVGHQFNALENGVPQIDLVQENYNTGANVRSLLFNEETLAKIRGASPALRWQHEIDAWGIDTSIGSSIAALLSDRHKVIPFPYDSSAFRQDGVLHFGDVDKNATYVADIIRAQPNYATAKDIDAFIVVIPAGRELTADFDRASYGVGILKDFQAYQALSATFEDVYMLHAFYYVMVLDGRNLTQLGAAVAHHDTLYQKRFHGNPAEFVDQSYWAATYDQMTPTQRDQIVARVKEMVASTLPGTLRELGLLR